MAGCSLFGTRTILAVIPFTSFATVAAQTNGSRIFAESCADCHSAGGTERAPRRFLLGSMSPRAIVAALEFGAMSSEGADLTREQRIAVGEYLSGRSFSKALLPETAFCVERGPGALDLQAVSWMGFGGNLAGTGFQSSERAGLSASDVPNLELRWAFGFPDASQVRTKPTVVGDVILVGGPVRGGFRDRSGHRSCALEL